MNMCVFRPGPEKTAFYANFREFMITSGSQQIYWELWFSRKVGPGGPSEPYVSIRFFIYSGPGSANAGFHIYDFCGFP